MESILHKTSSFGFWRWPWDPLCEPPKFRNFLWFCAICHFYWRYSAHKMSRTRWYPGGGGGLNENMSNFAVSTADVLASLVCRMSYRHTDDDQVKISILDLQRTLLNRLKIPFAFEQILLLNIFNFLTWTCILAQNNWMLYVSKPESLEPSPVVQLVLCWYWLLIYVLKALQLRNVPRPNNVNTEKLGRSFRSNAKSHDQ